MNERCPQCGAMVLPEENFCPQCGAALKAGEAGATIYETLPPQTASQQAPHAGPPRTIGELKAFCDRNGMPLEKMRFFVGVDYREPRAFGIYRDGDGFVVYKNKADGSRAVRYNGPDEAYAVNELYQKLLGECHRRNIWPDGKPETAFKAEKRKKRLMLVLVIAILVVAGLTMFFAYRAERKAHAHDGYYTFDDGGLYYRYGDSWYYDDPYYDWILWNGIIGDDYDDYYMGGAYDSDWGYSSFEDSSTWRDIQREEQERHTSSDDYDSWDSGDTDWDSDW